MSAHTDADTSRFWDKVDKSGDCWNWIGTRTRQGYGQFSLHGRMVRAHRFAYEVSVGPIPDGLFIDHLCHNKSCVNPSHLRPASVSANTFNRAGAQSNSRTGVRGVCWSTRDQIWIVTARQGSRSFRYRVRDFDEAQRLALELRSELAS